MDLGVGEPLRRLPLPGRRITTWQRYWVLVAIIGIEIAIFAAQSVSGHERLFWQDFGISNSFFQGYFWEPVTSIFVHLNLTHLLGNLIALTLVGVVVLNYVGVRGFLLIFILSGIVGALVALWLSPAGSDTIGASGAIFGLTTAAIVVLRRRRAPTVFMVLWLALSVISSFHAGVSWQMHLGGAVGGVAAALLVLWHQGRLGKRQPPYMKQRIT